MKEDEIFPLEGINHSVDEYKEIMIGPPAWEEYHLDRDSNWERTVRI